MSVQKGRADSLEESEIFHILGNDRRRAIVGLLADGQEHIAVSDVATEIADDESETTPVPNNLYKSVYVSLQQTHLPQLEEDDVIEYDADAKTIRQGSNFEAVLEYIDSDSGAGERVLQLHLVACVLGLVLITIAGVGVPVLSSVNPVLWSVLILLAVAISSLYSLLW